MSDATKAEATDEPTVSVKWRELSFDVPRDREEWSFDAVLAFEDGKAFVAIRELLTPDDFAEFRALKPKAKDAAALLDSIADAMGFKDSGE